MGLALLAAVSHAVFGALQKGRHDPWLTRGAIDVSYALMALPVALFLVPWPEGRVWALLARRDGDPPRLQARPGDGLQPRRLHRRLPDRPRHRPARHRRRRRPGLRRALHRRAMGGRRCCSRAASSRSRPPTSRRRRIDRGVLAAGGRRWRCVTGGFVAAYTTYDAYGIRATPDPFTFLAWFFVADGLIFPVDRAGALPRHARPAGARAAPRAAASSAGSSPM